MDKRTARRPKGMDHQRIEGIANAVLTDVGQLQALCRTLALHHDVIGDVPTLPANDVGRVMLLMESRLALIHDGVQDIASETHLSNDREPSQPGSLLHRTPKTVSDATQPE